MTKTIIKILTGLLIFIAGVLIAYVSVGKVYLLIETIYQWTTGNAFLFYGKRIIVNLDPIYYLTFGFCGLALWTCLRRLELKEAIAWICLSTTIFLLTMLTYGLIDGNSRAASCTKCEDGIVRLHWLDLNYNLITEISLILGLAPLLFKTIKTKKPAHNIS
ncbi:MAG: hypothetical protein ACO1OQ_12185 [Rufibacter sp.]